MPPKSKRKTTTRVTRRTTVAAVRRAKYEVLRPAAELAKEVEAIWVARDAACVKPGSFYDFEDSRGSLGKFAHQNVVSEQMLQAVNDRFDSFNDFSLIVEEAKPALPAATKRACTPTNGVDSPLPKADKLSIDVFGDQGDGELAVEPVAGPSMLASRRSLPMDESGRGMTDAEMEAVQRAKTDASKAWFNPSQPALKTPARRSRSRTPLTEVFTKACHRLTSNDLMAIPSQKTVFVSTPVHTNRKSLRIDLSPIGKHASSPAASTRRTISAISTPPPRGPSILPPTDPTNATSSTSTISVLPPTDETEASPARITFDDVHTASIPPKKSILKSTQHAESTVKSAATTIQSLNFGDDESADMFEDSGPGFGDAVVSVVSDLNTESVHVSEVVADVSDEHMNSESRISKVEASKAVLTDGDASESVFVTPMQSMDASTSQMASPASVVASAPVGEAVDSAAERTLEDVDGSIVEWHATLDSSTVEDDKALSTSNRVSEVAASSKSTDSVSRLHTPFVSVRKSHRPSVQCDADKENSVASGSRTFDKENSIVADTIDPSDSTALIDKPVLEAPSIHDSDAIPTESDDESAAELEAIAYNRAMSQSPVHRTESQLTNRTNVDHGYSRANESCRSDITVASAYTTFTVKAADPNKALFYLDGFAGEATDLNHLCFVSGQSSVQPWKAAVRQLDLSGAKKIGEGAFGEVYVAKLNGVKVALKVFPFRESEDPSKRYPLINDGEMMPAASIMSEVVVTKTLSALSDTDSRAPNFVPLHKTFVVKGTYPKELLAAWNAFNKTKGSENTSPTEYDSVTRHYIVMALGFGGVDLESYVLRSYNKAMSILLQVALALAVAELELEFEHRDLHWGNILICEEDVPEFIEYVVEGNEVRVRSHGVRVVIIDFTNSRIFKDGVVVYMDLSVDEVLFQGQGDPQFQVYRDMRAINGDDWSLYKPETNALWLDYLVDKLFNGIEGKRPKFAKKQRDEAVKKLAFTKECSSAADFLKQSLPLFTAFYGSDTNDLFS